LVCDDDQAILDSLEIYLRLEGHRPLRAANGREALARLEENEVHCAILDIMMPGMDGLNATLKLREKHNLPVILLSAKSEDTDKITGLGFGADDYVTKPFNPLELMARVKSQLRRYTQLGASPQRPDTLATGGLCLDLAAKEVTVDGDPVKLTATEFGIVRFLMENLGRVLSAEQIYQAVWNEPAYLSEKTVTVHIRRIREKIEINSRDPKYLKVVWGIGYKIEKLPVR
jgi:DNA-binding response OmpR family regulator